MIQEDLKFHKLKKGVTEDRSKWKGRIRVADPSFKPEGESVIANEQGLALLN